MSERVLTITIGVAAGIAWNLASLWCLSRMLAAWLVPPPARGGAITGLTFERRPESRPATILRFQSAFGGRWQVVGWLLVKFPLLYLLAFALLRGSSVSLVGFGAGFSAVLVVMLAAFALRAQRRIAVPSNGR